MRRCEPFCSHHVTIGGELPRTAGRTWILSKDRNEWAADGKNFLNGLFKMLHTDSSHAGLSDEDHSTFRLHLALITGRALLRRLSNRT